MKLIVEIEEEGVYVYRETEDHFAEIEENGRGGVKVSHEVIDEECNVFENPELGVGTYMVFDLAETQTANNITSKPAKKEIKHYDYHECAEYIAKKLGVPDLRDFAGKYDGTISDKPYQDFWHEVLDNNQEVHNGDYVYISSEDDYPDWAEPIVDAFIKEFGDHQKYWVEW